MLNSIFNAMGTVVVYAIALFLLVLAGMVVSWLFKTFSEHIMTIAIALAVVVGLALFSGEYKHGQTKLEQVPSLVEHGYNKAVGAGVAQSHKVTK